MQIDREIVVEELNKFLDEIFGLPEIAYAKIRDVVIPKGEQRTDRLQTTYIVRRWRMTSWCNHSILNTNHGIWILWKFGSATKQIERNKN